MDADTAVWLGRITDELQGKLAAVGLIPRRASAVLDEFLGDYIDGRTDLKPRTVYKLQLVRRELCRFFAAGKPLREITPGAVEEFQRDLFGRMAPDTARRTLGRCKQFFRFAVRKRLIQEDPFGDLKGLTVKGNRQRDYFVTREEAQRVLDACPDAQWRLLFALSRYGGLRCPSEHLGLRWGDVDWERSRMTIYSPKTEHHEGRDHRQIPIFPELRPYLEEVFDQAEPGTEWVITRYRDNNANLRTQLERIIRRAGLQPWPKLFQNLRSTRETELAETFPMHVVCAWIGNSQPVAAKHYLQLTDEHFDRALVSAEAAQNRAHAAHVGVGNASSKKGEAPAFPEEYEGLPTYTNVQAPRRGLEPRTQRLTAACSTN
jgi:integrase